MSGVVMPDDYNLPDHEGAAMAESPTPVRLTDEQLNALPWELGKNAMELLRPLRQHIKIQALMLAQRTQERDEAREEAGNGLQAGVDLILALKIESPMKAQWPEVLAAVKQLHATVASLTAERDALKLERDALLSARDFWKEEAEAAEHRARQNTPMNFAAIAATLKAECERQHDEVTRLTAVIDGLRPWLSHKPDCAALHPGVECVDIGEFVAIPKPCSCGLADLGTAETA